MALAGVTAQADSFIKSLAAEDEYGSTSMRSSEEGIFSKSIKFSQTKSMEHMFAYSSRKGIHISYFIHKLYISSCTLYT